jgi:hypothetical protein
MYVLVFGFKPCQIRRRIMESIPDLHLPTSKLLMNRFNAHMLPSTRLTCGSAFELFSIRFVRCEQEN